MKQAKGTWRAAEAEKRPAAFAGRCTPVAHLQATQRQIKSKVNFRKSLVAF